MRIFYTEDTGGDFSSEGSDSAALETFDSGFTVEDSPAKPQERVEGEQPPDFGNLGRQKKDEKKPDPTKTAKKEEKPAGEAPESGAKPAKEQAKAKEEPKKAAEPAKAEKKPAEAEKKQPEEKTEEKAKADPAKIPTDAEIDALQPKPGAPTQVIKDFGQMRGKMKELAATARAATDEVSRIKSEAEGLRKNAGQIPDEVKQELEGLRQFSLLFNAQNDPTFRAEFDGRIQTAQEKLISYIEQNSPKDAPFLAEIKAAAEEGDIEKWPHWDKLIEHFKSPLARQQAINLFQARRDAISAKHEQLKKLESDREGYFKNAEEKDAAEKQKWARDMTKTAVEITADLEYTNAKEVPENASKEVKASIEAHNAKVAQVAESFKQNVLEAYNRNPAKIAELAVAGIKAEKLQEELEAKDLKLTAAEERVKSLEAQIQKIKSAGRVAHVSEPGGETSSSRKSTVPEGQIGGDGSSAMANWFAKK